MPEPVYDLAIIGGGINGCGIARDAAGRGLSVYLCEQATSASGTSSASTKLIHGGLRYLEYYEFRLVREALREREVLLAASRRTSSGRCASCCRTTGPAARLAAPARPVPLRPSRRPQAPAADTQRSTCARSGRRAAEAAIYTLGFEYSDCWVDDARLVVLNAMRRRRAAAP